MDFLMFVLGSVLTGIGILALQHFSLPDSEREEDHPRDELLQQVITSQAEWNRQLLDLVRVLTVHEARAERTATILASADRVPEREEIRPGTTRNGHIVPEREDDTFEQDREARDVADDTRRLFGDIQPAQDHMSLLAKQFAHIQTPDGGSMIDPR